MRRIGLLTWGSHGDIRPFLALAGGLQAAGHAVHLVVIALDDTHAGLQSSQGARVTVLTPLKLSPEQARAYGEAAYRERNPLRQLDAILRLCFAPAQGAIFEAARQLCETSDVVIGHYVMHPLQIAAELAGRPYVGVQLSPVGIPSAFAHPSAPAWLGRVGHRLLWKLTRLAVHRVVAPYVNGLRREVELPPVRDVLREVWLSPTLNLVAVSPQLCPRPPDWPAHLEVCGFLDMPNEGLEGTMPAGLEDFLAAGEAPIYLTLGSWMPREIEAQTRVLALMTEAAARAGCRAIIQCHDAAACGFASDARVLFVPIAPHQRIFPRCRAVVHHGGAGTTQSATQAGVPSVVIAHISEQRFWAGALRRLGVAGSALDRRSVTAHSLAAALRRVMADPQMAARAREAARAMQGEDGVAAAVRGLERRFSRIDRSGESGGNGGPGR